MFLRAAVRLAPDTDHQILLNGAAAVNDMGIDGEVLCHSRRCKCHQDGKTDHPIAPIIWRPTSMRRISDVPAPISISLASRKMRATGASFRNPAPPIACTA